MEFGDRLIKAGGELECHEAAGPFHLLAHDDAQRRDMRVDHRRHLVARKIAHGQQPAERAGQDRDQRITECRAITGQLMRYSEDRRDRLTGQLFRRGEPGRAQIVDLVGEERRITRHHLGNGQLGPAHILGIELGADEFGQPCPRRRLDVSSRTAERRDHGQAVRFAGPK
jgi:hypothetical protein